MRCEDAEADSVVFFFNDTATTEIYTLSLHDALPIFHDAHPHRRRARLGALLAAQPPQLALDVSDRRVLDQCRRQERRSEEHTSELQSRQYLVCRLLLEKKQISSCYIHYADDCYDRSP